MSELAATTNTQAMAVADAIHDALNDNSLLGEAPRWASKDRDARKASFVELVSTVLQDQADNYPCHDWIGEALHRRLECVAAIEKLGERNDMCDKLDATAVRLSNEVDQLNAALEVEMDDNQVSRMKIESLEHSLDIATRSVSTVESTRAGSSNPFPKPMTLGVLAPCNQPAMYNAEGFREHDGDTWLPINPHGYIAYYPDNMGVGTVIMDELAETRTIGGQDDDTTLEDDIESGLAECFELGAQVRPQTRVVWSVCDEQ